MKVILIRHGQAAPYCDNDAGRDLTHFGQAQAKQTAKHLLAKHTVDFIIASPFNRAKQTAQILQESIKAQGGSAHLVIVDGITPEADPKQGLIEIDKVITQSFGDAQDICVAVVCHMPIVAKMTAILLGDFVGAFELAEYRTLEMPAIAPIEATQTDGFIPSQPA